MKFFVSLLLVFSITAQAGAPIIFSGNDAKTLKPNIDLFGSTKILSGSLNPSSTATNAPKGSLYMSTSTGLLYRKSDAGSSTNWNTLAAANVTTWTAYTPTLTGFGTPTNVSFVYRQVGSSYEVRGVFTTGTVSSSAATITLPLGSSIDTAQMPTGNTDSNPGPMVGQWGQNGANNNAGYLVTATSTAADVVYFGSGFSVSNAMLTPQGGNGVMNSSLKASVSFTVPISGL